MVVMYKRGATPATREHVVEIKDAAKAVHPNDYLLGRPWTQRDSAIVGALFGIVLFCVYCMVHGVPTVAASALTALDRVARQLDDLPPPGDDDDDGGVTDLAPPPTLGPTAYVAGSPTAAPSFGALIDPGTIARSQHQTGGGGNRTDWYRVFFYILAAVLGGGAVGVGGHAAVNRCKNGAPYRPDSDVSQDLGRMTLDVYSSDGDVERQGVPKTTWHVVAETLGLQLEGYPDMASPRSTRGVQPVFKDEGYMFNVASQIFKNLQSKYPAGSQNEDFPDTMRREFIRFVQEAAFPAQVDANERVEEDRDSLDRSTPPPPPPPPPAFAWRVVDFFNPDTPGGRNNLALLGFDTSTSDKRDQFKAAIQQVMVWMEQRTELSPEELNRTAHLDESGVGHFSGPMARYAETIHQARVPRSTLVQMETSFRSGTRLIDASLINSDFVGEVEIQSRQADGSWLVQYGNHLMMVFPQVADTSL